MAHHTHRSPNWKLGAGLGVVAGVIFAVMEIAGAALMGDPPLMPLRMFASIVLGQEALMGTSAGVAFVVGLIIHLILSASFGLIYGAIAARLDPDTQASYGKQAGLGLVFGAALWLVNFQIIARVIYPWFLGAPQMVQLVMHALFFGLPLGLMFAAAAHRAGEPMGVRRPTTA